MINCNQCEALMINGVFCHETGCPNSRKLWSGHTWVKTRKCGECGDTVAEHTPCCDWDHEDSE